VRIATLTVVGQGERRSRALKAILEWDLQIADRY